VSDIFALVIRRTNWERLSQKYTLKMWGKFTSERVIRVLYQVSSIDAMVITRCGKMLD
jgi:spore coat polysaccharide biosynthesis protein SpsF (cytidylyltransferase family)